MKKLLLVLALAPFTAWAQQSSQAQSPNYVQAPNAHLPRYGSSTPIIAPDLGDYAERRLQEAQRQAEQQDLLRQQQLDPSLVPPSFGPGSSTPAIPGMGIPGMGQQTQVQPQQPEVEKILPPSPQEEWARQAEQWNSDTSQQLRQSGGSMGHPPHRGFFFSSSSSDKSLLHDWVHELKNHGVSEEKIIFEAKRLNKEDFLRWASRFVWWEDNLHPNVTDVYP